MVSFLRLGRDLIRIWRTSGDIGIRLFEELHAGLVGNIEAWEMDMKQWLRETFDDV